MSEDEVLKEMFENFEVDTEEAKFELIKELLTKNEKISAIMALLSMGKTVWSLSYALKDHNIEGSMKMVVEEDNELSKQEMTEIDPGVMAVKIVKTIWSALVVCGCDVTQEEFEQALTNMEMLENIATA